jgi:hypothetical protein
MRWVRLGRSRDALFRLLGFLLDARARALRECLL